MYLQAIELKVRDTLNKAWVWLKTWVPAVMPALIICGMILGITGSLLYSLMKTDPIPTSTDEAWEHAGSLAIPIVTNDDGEAALDWDRCLMVNLSKPGCHASFGNYPLPDHHHWNTGEPYACLDLLGAAFTEPSVEGPTALDLLILPEIPEQGCRWSCDPETEPNCT